MPECMRGEAALEGNHQRPQPPTTNSITTQRACVLSLVVKASSQVGTNQCSTLTQHTHPACLALAA